MPPLRIGHQTPVFVEAIGVPSDAVHPQLPVPQPDEPEWFVPGGDPNAADDVGEFGQGSPLSQWALARYLVGRAIGESVGISLMLVALVVLGLAVLVWVAGSVFWAVLVGVVALAVLAMRALLLAVLRRLTAAGQFRPVEQRMRRLVRDTRADVLRELRRIGLPGRTFTLPLLGWRLVGRRRGETFTRLRGFDIDRAVPRARLDELHLLLRSLVGRPAPGSSG